MYRLDPHPFSRGGSVAICTVSLMHIVQAGMLLGYQTAGGATGLIGLLGAFHAMGSPDGLHFMAAAMIVTAVLALVGALFRLGRIRLAIFLPQHVILGVMAIGAMWAVRSGAYLDGTVIPWPHIFTDQLVLPALFLIHSSAIVRRARDPNG